MHYKMLAALVILVLTATSLISILPVNAQTKTLTVPDDYLTITDATANAHDGDTIFVRKGIYEEPINQTLVIDKSISLIGENPSSTFVVLHPAKVPNNIFGQTFWVYSEPIAIYSDDVKISGLTVVSDGGNISVIRSNVQILKCKINTGILANGNRIVLTDNTFTSGNIQLNGSQILFSQNSIDGAWAISLEGFNNYLTSNEIKTGSVTIKGISNLVHGNLITTNESASNRLYIIGNENFIARNYIINGLTLKGSSNNACANRILSGISIDEGNNNTVYGNEGFSPYGIALTRSYNNSFYSNNFAVGKRFNLEIQNSEETSQIPWNTDFKGNYWSDYTGSDKDFDGTGDSMYVMHAVDPYQTSFSWDSKADGLPAVWYQPQLIEACPLMKPVDISSIKVDLPDWVNTPLPSALSMPILDEPLMPIVGSSPDNSPPEVTILSPSNNAHLSGKIQLSFKVNEPPLWIGYEVDNQEKVTLFTGWADSIFHMDGEYSLEDLSDGTHALTIYVVDTYGNRGKSETIHFSVAQEPFRWTVIISTLGLLAILISAGAFFYSKKRRLSGLRLIKKRLESLCFLSCFFFVFCFFGFILFC